MTKGQGSGDSSKTVKITVTVPADIAEQVDQAPNRSAYVTASLRASLARDQLTKLFGKRGITVDPARVAKMRERVAAQEIARTRKRTAA